MLNKFVQLGFTVTFVFTLLYPNKAIATDGRNWTLDVEYHFDSRHFNFLQFFNN